MVLLEGRDGVPRLADRAYATLEEAIVSLTLLPGTALSENALADRLGISRSPIRQALRLLEHQGLVDILPQRGTYVSRIDCQEAIEVLQMRTLIENWAINELEGHGARPDLEKLRGLLAKQAQAVEAGQYSLFLSYDSDFHSEIILAAGNRTAASMFAQLNLKVSRIRTWSLRRMKTFDRGVVEHRAILDGVERADWVEVRRLLTAATDELIDAVREIEQAEPDWVVTRTAGGSGDGTNYRAR